VTANHYRCQTANSSEAYKSHTTYAEHYFWGPRRNHADAANMTSWGLGFQTSHGNYDEHRQHFR